VSELYRCHRDITITKGQRNSGTDEHSHVSKFQCSLNTFDYRVYITAFHGRRERVHDVTYCLTKAPWQAQAIYKPKVTIVLCRNYNDADIASNNMLIYRSCTLQFPCIWNRLCDDGIFCSWNTIL